MTDLITRARKEWCEFSQRVPAPPGLGLERYYGHLSGPTPCPPEVVAALLDMLENYPANRTLIDDDESPCCPTSRFAPHTNDCFVGLAEAAITRALEGRP